ncbi:HAD-IA family hydrolase [Priestia megaterium]|nr:HAD-IA family hydrolase [Priestia megaterium]
MEEITMITTKSNTLCYLNNINTIILDLDGTIYPESGITSQIKMYMRQQAAKTLGVNEQNALRMLKTYAKQYATELIGLKELHGINPEYFLEEVYSQINISTIESYEGVRENLRELSKFYTLVLTTNSNRGHAKRVIEKFKLTNIFDFIFSVEDWEFIRKPNPLVFNGILEKVGIEAMNAILFDDSYLNLNTAKKIGMKTVLVSNNIVEPPFFFEMHKQEKHLIPSSVDIATHNISDVLQLLLRKYQNDAEKLTY